MAELYQEVGERMLIRKVTFSKFQMLSSPFVFFFIAHGILNTFTKRETYSLSQTVWYFVTHFFLYLVVPLFLFGTSSYFRKRTKISIIEKDIVSMLHILNTSFCLSKIDLDDVEGIWHRSFALSAKSTPVLTLKFLLKDNSRISMRNIEFNDELIKILQDKAIQTAPLKGFFGSKSRIPSSSYSVSLERKKLAQNRMFESRTDFRYSHDRGGQVARFSQVLATLMIVYILATGSLFEATSNTALNRFEQLNSSVNSDDRVDFSLKVIDIDPITKLAQVQLLPQPMGNIGFTTQNGWIPNDQITFEIGSTRRVNELQQSNTLFFGSELQPNISATADITYQNPFGACIERSENSDTGETECTSREYIQATIKDYPFDRYLFSLPIFNVASRTGGAGTETVVDDTYVSVPMRVYNDTSELNTWDVVVYPISTNYRDEFQNIDAVSSGMNQGSVEFLIDAKRDRYTILLVLIVCLLMVASMMSVILMGISVSLRYRPPTVQALVWAAALTFSLIQLRTLMPGAPPVGTTLDILFYFPALLMTIGGSIWILWHWMRRADYGI
jgi:hypothetical protein